MSHKEFGASHSQQKPPREKVGRSFELPNGGVCTVDRELDRLFHEFWESADRSSALVGQRIRGKASADTDRRAVVDPVD